MPSSGVLRWGGGSFVKKKSNCSCFAFFNVFTSCLCRWLCADRSPTVQVEKLILETCLLRTKGGKAILEALGSNTALQELDMSYNDMWAEAVPVAVRVLGARKTLTRVAMHGNQFGDDGLAELEKGIPRLVRRG